MKLSFVLGGDTGLFCDGVCHELTTEEDEGDTARGCGWCGGCGAILRCCCVMTVRCCGGYYCCCWNC